MQHQGDQRNPDNTVPTSSSRDQRDGRIIAKLNDAILACLAASNPPQAVTQELRLHIDENIRGFLPNFDTPSHPPYALMIQKAIVELNEKGGSREESISGFIRKEYEGLPWQHEACLSHHLRKLCKTGEIVLTNNGRYVIVVKHGDFGDRKETGHRMIIRLGRRKPCKRQFRDELHMKLKEKVRDEIHLTKHDIEKECRAGGQEIKVIDDWNKVKKGQTDVFVSRCEVKEHAVEERNEASIQVTKAIDEQLERPSVELNDEEQNNPQYQQIEVLEESSHLQDLQSEASEKHNSACEWQNVVVLNQNKPQEPQIEAVYEKQKDDQVIVSMPNASESSSKCLHCNAFSVSLEEPCMESMKKKTEFPEELKENSHSLGRVDLPKYGLSEPVMEEEKKDFLELQQQRLSKSSLTESESSIKVFEAHSKLQRQENGGLLLREESQHLEKDTEVSTEVLGSCCVKEDRIRESFWVPLGEVPFIMEKDERAKCSEQKQHKKKIKIIHGERKFTIICSSLQSQKLSDPKMYGRWRARKSDQARSLPLPKPDTVTTMGDLLASEDQHDEEEHQPEDQGQGEAQNLLKSKFYGRCRAWNSEPENHQQDQSPGQAKSLPTPKQDTDTTMSELLPSDRLHDDEQHQPEHQGRVQGRIQNAEGGGDHHYHDGLCIRASSLRTYVRRKRKG